MERLAKKLALKSTHKQHHHAAILTRGGAIIATGYNHETRHAEMVALGQLFPDNAKGCTLYSFRWRKNGTWGNAKPCSECAKYLVGVKVYYTDAGGKLVRG